MALHPEFLDPAVRWFPADEALRESTIYKQQGVDKSQSVTLTVYGSACIGDRS